jgi:L-aminopeptidase/D-esterase-like protein
MAARAGPRNLITDVPGILVGQAEDRAGITGTTVVLAEGAAAASVDVRGGAPGSRETELLAAGTLVNCIDAVVFAIAEKIAVLHQGRVLAEGRPDEVRSDPEVRRVYLGGHA